MKKNVLNSLVLIIILAIYSCNSLDTVNKTNNIADSVDTPILTKNLHKENRNVNDSLTKALLNLYPSALIVDSIHTVFTLSLQKALEKSSNIVFLSEAYISDIEIQNGKYILSINNYYPKIFGKLIVNSEHFDRLYNNLSLTELFQRCCIVIKITKLLPIQNQIKIRIDNLSAETESDDFSMSNITDNIYLDLDSFATPAYFIEGELIDFCVLDIIKDE